MKIVNVKIDDPLLPQIEQLYTSSFSLVERRRWKDLMQIIYEPKMNLQKITIGEAFVGLVVWWSLNKWLYIEHLAIEPASRGKGIGKLVMEQLVKLSNGNLILETEQASDEISKRRIVFYEKFGLRIVPFNYTQPPYRKNETGLTMHLMSLPGITDVLVFDNLRRLIETEVYEKFRVE